MCRGGGQQKATQKATQKKAMRLRRLRRLCPSRLLRRRCRHRCSKPQKWRRPAKRKQVKRQQVKRPQVKRPPSERQLQQLEAEAAEALNTERYLEEQLAMIEVDLTNLLKAQKNTSDSLDAARQETRYKQSLANEARKKEVS